MAPIVKVIGLNHSPQILESTFLAAFKCHLDLTAQTDAIVKYILGFVGGGSINANLFTKVGKNTHLRDQIDIRQDRADQMAEQVLSIKVLLKIVDSLCIFLIKTL